MFGSVGGYRFNVGKNNVINHPLGNGFLYHLFMVKFGMVYYCFYQH